MDSILDRCWTLQLRRSPRNSFGYRRILARLLLFGAYTSGISSPVK